LARHQDHLLHRSLYPNRL